MVARARLTKLVALTSLLALLVWLSACRKSAGRDYASSPDAAGAYALDEDQGAADEPAPSSKTWKRSVLDTHQLRIQVGDEQTLPVEAVEVRASVDGFRARVLLDVDFENTWGRRVEGTLQLRLPEGASMYFLAFGPHAEGGTPVPVEPLPVAADPTPSAPALKIAAELTPEAIMASARPWVRPKQAIMVERDQAAGAYRATVRRNVDPAISEWAGAGVFNMRLFPLDPLSKNRVVIGYDVDLTEIDDGWRLPLVVPEATQRSLRVEVATPPGLDISLTSPEQDAALAPTIIEGRAHYELTEPPALVELALTGAKSAALIGQDPRTGPFFAVRTSPALPGDLAAEGPGRAVFVVDTSMSQNPEGFNVWLDLLAAILEQNRDPGPGQLREFALLLFNVDTFWWAPEFRANDPAALTALRDDMNRLALEGATDLGAALREASAPAWARDQDRAWDLFLLSDGAATWGDPSNERVIRDLVAGLDGRVFTYRTGLPGADTTFLQRLARDSGGAVFSVTGPDEVAKAAIAHRSQPWELLSVRAAGVEDLLVAGDPRHLYPGQSLTVAGRAGEQAPGELELVVRRGDEQRTVVAALPEALESELAPRIYGQLAVTELERFYGQDGVDALGYARHFRVTGRSASLLMLESQQDYDDAGIEDVSARDAQLVLAQPAGATLELAEQRFAAQLGDPRAELIATIDRADTIVGLASPDELTALVAQLPASSFELDLPPLRCARHDRAAIDRTLLEALATRELDYDLVSAAAETRRQQVGPADGLKALSSLVEANPGDPVLARDVAFTAQQWGLGPQVYQLLLRVAATRPEEPQTYHALALLSAEVGAADLAQVYFELAMRGNWDQRFGSFHQIVAVDYLRFLRTTPADALSGRELAAARRSSLSQNLRLEQADLLVLMTWNTDATDVDLHVVEPGGFEVYYAKPRSRAGGRLSQDVTQGYGPEMYFIPSAKRGRYEIKARYYASDRLRTSTRTKVYITVVRDFGRPSEVLTREVVSLSDDKDMHEVTTLHFPAR